MCKAGLLTPQHFLPLLWLSYPRPFLFSLVVLQFICSCSCCDCIPIYGFNSRLPHVPSYLIFPYVQTVDPHLIIPIRTFPAHRFGVFYLCCPCYFYFVFFFVCNLRYTFPPFFRQNILQELHVGSIISLLSLQCVQMFSAYTSTGSTCRMSLLSASCTALQDKGSVSSIDHIMGQAFYTDQPTRTFKTILDICHADSVSCRSGPTYHLFIIVPRQQYPALGSQQSTKSGYLTPEIGTTSTRMNLRCNGYLD
jgi:hypothetical protein